MAHSSHEFLRCENLKKTYFTESGPVAALTGVSLSLKEQETISIVGPSGCGKSTLLFIMAGLEKPTGGNIIFRGIPLERAHKEIALVLQDYGLFPWKTVQKNIELGIRIRRDPVDRQMIADLLGELGISEKTELYPQQLSGGQRQRVALARALVLNPSLLLLDEPFASVDAMTRERLQDIVGATWRSRRFGMVVVTHNIQEAVGLGKKVLVMGGNPGSILMCVENPRACEEGYCVSDEFYDTCRMVRNELEQVS
jgi:NitT/TauT family transport system ATP-binding protein